MSKKTRPKTTDWQAPYDYGGLGYGYGGCGHQDGTLIFSLPRPGRAPLELYAGSFRGLGDQDLVIDLAGNFAPAARAFACGEDLGAWSRNIGRPLLKIAWPDGGTPALEKRDWLELTRSLLASPFNSVYACCTGGHGRTGTFFTVLGCCLSELGHPGIPGGDPVAWLREHYCSEVVETTAQTEYILRLTGRVVTSSHAYRDRGTRRVVTKVPTLPELQDETKAFGFASASFTHLADETDKDYLDYLGVSKGTQPEGSVTLDYSEVEFLLGVDELERCFPAYNWSSLKGPQMEDDLLNRYYLFTRDGVSYLAVSGEGVSLFGHVGE